MVEITLKVGGFIVKLSYIFCLIAVIAAGLLSIFSPFGEGFLVGLEIIVLGLPLVVLLYYTLFLFIDIHTQLVKLNKKA
ncbi:hypothetical protein [uncultured Helicobacter sp.]|uniref:hypothetical protein n=1 Tax=uncultured Helicobacter sp. TaxID=175537 RepID=UPI00260765E6|nr:hypothetical protein [uncultured Helicobacter sp.]